MASTEAATSLEPNSAKELKEAVAKRFNSSINAYATTHKTNLNTRSCHQVVGTKTTAYTITIPNLSKDLDGIDVIVFHVNISEKLAIHCRWMLSVPIQDKGRFFIKHHVRLENEASSAPSPPSKVDENPNFWKSASIDHCEVHFSGLGWATITNGLVKKLLAEVSLFFKQIGDPKPSSDEWPDNVLDHHDLPKKPACWIYTDENDRGTFWYIKKQFDIQQVPLEERINKWTNEIEETEVETDQIPSTEIGVMSFVQSTVPTLEWLEKVEKSFDDAQESGFEPFGDFEMKVVEQIEPEKPADPMVTVLWWKGPPASADDIVTYKQPFSQVIKVWEGVRASEPVRFFPQSQSQGKKGITPMIDMIVYRGTYAAKELEEEKAQWSYWFHWWYDTYASKRQSVKPTPTVWLEDVSRASNQHQIESEKIVSKANVSIEKISTWAKVCKKRQVKNTQENKVVVW